MSLRVTGRAEKVSKGLDVVNQLGGIPIVAVWTLCREVAPQSQNIADIPLLKLGEHLPNLFPVEDTQVKWARALTPYVFYSDVHGCIDWFPTRAVGDAHERRVSALQSPPAASWTVAKLSPPWVEKNFKDKVGFPWAKISLIFITFASIIKTT